ncbi:MAG TPA: hypothetical protein VIE89_31305 [Candidatus Binatia bacterium]|jgi:hypothetical protein
MKTKVVDILAVIVAASINRMHAAAAPIVCHVAAGWVLNSWCLIRA